MLLWRISPEDIKQMTVGDVEVIMFENDFNSATIKSFNRRGIDIEKSMFPDMTVFFNKATGHVEVKYTGDWAEEWKLPGEK